MLEEILQKYFGCKKPFLKKRKITGYYAGGEPDYEYLTRAGGKHYERLVNLMYDLEKLLGKSFDSHLFVKWLDEIVTSEGR